MSHFSYVQSQAVLAYIEWEHLQTLLLLLNDRKKRVEVFPDVQRKGALAILPENPWAMVPSPDYPTPSWMVETRQSTEPSRLLFAPRTLDD